VQDATDSNGVGKYPGRLAHAALRVDSLELARVQEGIPAAEVDQSLVELNTGILKLGKVAARMQVVVVLVDLAQDIAHLQVPFVVVGPVLFAAIERDAAVGTLKLGVLGQLTAPRGVVRVRAARVPLDEPSSLPDSADRR